MRPILFRIPIPFLAGEVPLYSYGFMTMLGFIAATLVARRRARRVGLSPDNITDVALWALLGGIVGSRIVYVAQNAGYYFNTSRPDWSLLDLFKLWEGGLVFYGGFIGALCLALLVMRIKKERILAVLDVLAPSLALGHAFGRVGCLMRGCCYGVAVDSDAWYGLVFPNDALAYDPAALQLSPAGTPVFPTQPVSSLNLLVIFALLSVYFKHRRSEGEVIGLYLALYSIHRFVVEFFRGDTHVPGALSPAQWLSLFAFFGGLGLWVYVRGAGAAKEKAMVKRGKG